MRFNSLLLVAVLCAGLHPSSIRSISTSVGRLRSIKGNVRAYPIEVDTITEERAPTLPRDLNINAFDYRMVNFNNDINLSTQGLLRDKLEPHETLQLHNEDTRKSRNVLLQFWFKIFFDLGMPQDLAAKLLTHFDENSFVETIDVLKELKVQNTILGNFMDAQITFWKDQKKTPLEVFRLLKLDKLGSVYTPNELERFKMWIKFSTEKPDQSILEVCKNYVFHFRLRILDGLRQIEDTQNVKSMEAALVQSLPNRRGLLDIPILDAFVLLVGDGGLKKFLTHRNFKLFNEFAEGVIPKISNEEALIMGATYLYNDIRLGKMLFAAVKENNNAEAEDLLKELFIQWANARGNLATNEDIARQNKLMKKYGTFVKERRKREDA